MKKCSQCGKTKPVEDYYANGRQPCKACHRAAMKAYRESNPDRIRETRRRWERGAGREWKATYRAENRESLRAKDRERDLLRNYGLTAEDYDEMVLSQGDLCAICGLSETSIHPRSGGLRALAVDHDHETGAVRSLLCNRCNSAIGLFEDDPDLLIAAATYLQIARTPRRTA